MKINITDLMDDLSDDGAFLEDTDELAAKRVKRRTMEKISAGKSRKRLSKTLRGLVVAAAVIFALSVSAVATNYLSDGAIIEFFRHGAHHGPVDNNNALTDEQLLTIENCTTQFDESVTVNGMTVTLKSVTGAIVGNTVECVCVFELEAPMSLAGIDNDDLNFEWPFIDIGFTGSSGYLVIMDDAEGRDNVKTLVYSVGGLSADFSEDVRMIVNFENFWIERDKRQYTEVLVEGKWSLEVDLKLEKGIELIDEPFEIKNGVVVTGVGISPLGGYFNVTAPIGMPSIAYTIEKIVMRDGSSVIVEGGVESVIVNDDGSRVIVCDDGSSAIVNVDGSCTGVRPDGGRDVLWDGTSEGTHERIERFHLDVPIDLTDADYILLADGTQIPIG